MTRFHGGVFVLPALLLAASWVGSYFLFVQGRKFYLQTNAIRLDPLGLKVHSVTVPRGDEPIVVFFGDSRAAEWSPRLKSRSSSSGIWGSKKRCHSCLASFFRRIRLRKKKDARKKRCQKKMPGIQYASYVDFKGLLVSFRSMNALQTIDPEKKMPGI
jgi:hypothetical protein